jgi:hypothetical protein
MEKRDLQKLDIPLNGKLITSRDPAAIGPSNFRQLTNMCYRDTNPRSIGGMTKINTNTITHYKYNLSGIHYKKDQPSESHVIVQGWNATLDKPGGIYQNTIDIPGAGNFDTTALMSETSTSGIARFALAPNGNLVMCNKTGTYIYSGKEAMVGHFINYDPDNTFSYDYTDSVRNTSSTNLEDYAILSRVSGGVDSYTHLLLHFENTTDDASASSHHVTRSGATYTDNQKVFGSYAASFDGTNDYFRVKDRPWWTYNSGFSVEARIKFKSAFSSSTNPIYYHHNKAATAGAKLYIDGHGALHFRLIASNAATIGLKTEQYAVGANSWYHVEVDHSGTMFHLFLNGVLIQSRNKNVSPRNYNSSLEIGRDRSGNFYGGWIDEYRVSNTYRRTTTFELPTAAYNATYSYATYCYIGATKALKGFKVYMKTVNTTASEMQVEYWDGSAWAIVGALSDGTAAGGISLAQTGRVTFTSTDGLAKTSIIDGTMLYWYRMTVWDADSLTSIYQITTDAPMQTLKDVWDGINHNVLSFQVYKSSAYAEYTTNVYENRYDSADSGTWAELGGLTSSDYFVCGFGERQTAVQFYFVASKVNVVANTTCSVYYWNGNSWTSVGVINDGTLEGNKSMTKSGVISWEAPTAGLEFKKEITKELPLYYYKFVFNNTLTADVEVYYVSGFPAQKTIRGHAFAMESMNSVWLLSDQSQHKNRALKSAPDTADVFNGQESLEFFFGDETEITAGTGLFLQLGSNIYDSAVITKANETWQVIYVDGEYRQFRVSEDVGCVAPQTMRTVDLASVELVNTRRQVAIWQGADGIYVFDGKAPVCISDDISDYFDQTNASGLHRDKANKSYGFVDVANGRYHWLSASGTSNTLDKEWVYDLKRNKWFDVDRTDNKDLLSGFEVKDTTNNAYMYGCNRTGYMNRLECGNSFDGQPITATMWLGDAIPSGTVTEETVVRSIQLVMVAKTSTGNDVTCSYYKDNNSAADETLTFDPTKAGKRLSRPLVPMGREGPATFHSFKFQCSTDNETVGFEPLSVSLLHKWVRQRISEQ